MKLILELSVYVSVNSKLHACVNCTDKNFIFSHSIKGSNMKLITLVSSAMVVLFAQTAMGDDVSKSIFSANQGRRYMVGVNPATNTPCGASMTNGNYNNTFGSSDLGFLYSFSSERVDPRDADMLYPEQFVSVSDEKGTRLVLGESGDTFEIEFDIVKKMNAFAFYRRGQLSSRCEFSY